MPMFEIAIPRIIVQSVSIVADSEEAARKLANENYGIPEPLREQIDEYISDNPKWASRNR
jgi:hypothetical protein